MRRRRTGVRMSCCAGAGRLAGRRPGVERRQVFDAAGGGEVTSSALERECAAAPPRAAAAGARRGAYGPRIARSRLSLYRRSFRERRAALAELFASAVAGTVAASGRAAGRWALLERARERSPQSVPDSTRRIPRGGRLPGCLCRPAVHLLTVPPARDGGMRRWGSCRPSPGSPFMTLGRMTPTPLSPALLCAALRDCRPSPTAPSRRMVLGCQAAEAIPGCSTGERGDQPGLRRRDPAALAARSTATAPLPLFGPARPPPAPAR